MIDLKKIVFIRLLFNIYQISKIRKKYIYNIAGFLTIFATTYQISIARCVRSIFKMFRGMRYFFKRFKNCFLIVDFLRVRHRHVHPWVKHYSHAFWNSRTNQFLSGINILFPKLRCFLDKLYSYNFYIYKSHELTKSII